MDGTEYRIKRTWMLRMSHGEDLLAEAGKIALHKGISMAVFSIIGAVSCASFGYYDQKERRYAKISRDGDYEIISCYGNVSLKEDRPMAHAHILFGDEEGSTFGGHLMSPTRIFAAELFLQELDGLQLIRKHDNTTGLFLWE